MILRGRRVWLDGIATNNEDMIGERESREQPKMGMDEVGAGMRGCESEKGVADRDGKKQG